MTETAPERDFPGRRRFCRIDDEVILHFHPVDSDSGETHRSSAETDTHPFAFFARLAEQRERVRRQLQGARTESPKISRCLTALEERIELIEAALLMNQFEGFCDLRRSVQLSAGGISFRTTRPYSPETVLLLQMILVPTLTAIVTHGRVLRSVRQIARDNDPPYLTIAEFTDMKESTRDLIARHVLARQRHRQRRHQD